MNTPSSLQHSMDFTPVPSRSSSVAHSQMPSSSHPVGQISELLVSYRSYLWTLAFAHLGRTLQNKLDASDIVQQALTPSARQNTSPASGAASAHRVRFLQFINDGRPTERRC